MSMIIDSNSEFIEDLTVAVNAAEEAGNILDAFSRNRVNTWTKDDDSIVTEADIKSQSKILEILQESYPDDTFITEEGNSITTNSGRKWIIDPLDGTFNFQNNFGKYTVSIALEINDNIVAGVVHAPQSSLNKTYLSTAGDGAYVFTGKKKETATKLNVSSHNSITESIYFCANHGIKHEDRIEKQLINRLAEEGAIKRQLGACAIEMCYIAEGKAHLKYNPYVREWDYAASKLIVEEAGGRVDVLDTKNSKYKTVIVSNNRLHKKLKKIIDRCQNKSE